MMRRLGSSITALRMFAMLLATSACSGSGATGPQAAVDAARSRWVTNAPASYSMVVERSCECLPGASGRVLVTVRDGVVESRRYVADGTSVPPQYAASFPTVPEMFEMIEEATRNGVQPIDVRYSSLGYPTRIALGDPAVDAPLLTITDFHAL